MLHVISSNDRKFFVGQNCVKGLDTVIMFDKNIEDPDNDV